MNYLHGRIFLWENLYRIVQYSSSSGLGERGEQGGIHEKQLQPKGFPWTPSVLLGRGELLQRAVHIVQSSDTTRPGVELTSLLTPREYIQVALLLKLPFSKLYPLTLASSTQTGTEDHSWLETFMQILQNVT